MDNLYRLRRMRRDPGIGRPLPLLNDSLDVLAQGEAGLVGSALRHWAESLAGKTAHGVPEWGEPDVIPALQRYELVVEREARPGQWERVFLCPGCGQEIAVHDGTTECGGEGEGACEAAWSGRPDVDAAHEEALRRRRPGPPLCEYGFCFAPATHRSEDTGHHYCARHLPEHEVCSRL